MLRVLRYPVHLDTYPGISDYRSLRLDGYRQRNLHTVGSLQQLRTGEDNGVFRVRRWIRAPTGVDDLLLLEMRLCVTFKGNITVRIFYSAST